MGEVVEDAATDGTSKDRIARWAKLASETGVIGFLSPPDGFKACLNSGGAWANRDQPGIYSWLASYGEPYVGQSIMPQSRLSQHWRDHRDVPHACFMPCGLNQFNQLEKS